MVDHPQPPPDDEALLQLAIAIADGTPIEWHGRLPSEGDSAFASVSPLPTQLRQLERIVRGHHELQALSPTDPASATLLTEVRLRAGGTPDLEVHWGPLIVHEKIGRGSFGDVYRAWDPRLEREVALKLVSDERSPQFATSAFDEGRLLARVRHPHVVTVYGAERAQGRVGIWMEYLRGRSLAAEVAADGPMSAEQAARIGIDVCRALAAVHAAGLLHRDVKAQNVMRDSDGRIVLGDFGAGIAIGGVTEDADPPIAGTPLYLAPEILAGRPPSIGTDLYSVGVLLYFLVTGTYPTRGRSAREIRRAHEAGVRVPLSDARSDLPPAFVEIVEGLTEAGPDRRHGSAASAEAALARWLAGAEGPAVEPRRLRTWVAAALILTAIVVLTALPGVRSGVRSWVAGPLPGAGAPIARQVLDPPCPGHPSSDGQWIACVETISRVRERGGSLPPPLLLFNPHTGEVRTLRVPPPGERITSARISPDGHRVAFAAQVQSASDGASPPLSRNEIRVIDWHGQAERTVARLPEHVTIATVNDWGEHDGQILLRLWRRGMKQAAALLGTAGELQVIFEFDSPPQAFGRSPDGRYVAFDVRQSPADPERDIRLCELATGICEDPVAHPAFDFNAFWTPDGRLLFNSDRGGTMGLWSVRLDGLRAVGPPELLRDTGRGRMTPAGFGPDGLFFYSLSFGDVDAFAAAISDDGKPAVPVRVSTHAIDMTRSPVWSPDGRSLAYFSMRGPFAEQGAMQVVIRSEADGATRDFRYDIGAVNMTRLAWSPDGRHLSMRTILNGIGFGVHVLEAETGRIVRTLRRQSPPERFVEDQVSDTSWLDTGQIVFASAGGVGVFDVETGLERQIWSASGDARVLGMALSPGRDTAAVVLSGGEASSPAWFAVRTIRINDPSDTELFRVAAPEALWMQSWTPDGQAILVTRWIHTGSAASRMRELWKVPLSGAAATPMSLSMEELNELTIHPDGRRLAFTARAQRGEFWMTTLR